jgi:TetR/AcrR family transcriptional regulator, cholesterol catabolism regulator
MAKRVQSSILSLNGTKKSPQQRRTILRAAARLFRDRSFLATTIDDIALQAKVNKATIYYYFRSKSYLLYEILTEALSTLNEGARTAFTSSPSWKEKIRAIVRVHVEMEVERTSLGGIAIFERKNLPTSLRKAYDNQRANYEQVWREILQEGIKAGEIRPEDMHLTVRLILGLINSVALWFKQKGSLSPEKIASEISEFIIRGILFHINSQNQLNSLACIQTPSTGLVKVVGEEEDPLKN